MDILPYESMKKDILVLCLFLCFIKDSLSKNTHVVFIVADDLGWNDVGWHNSKILTPNLDSLAHSGIILNQSYVHQVCSPSRGAFMTGYYPFHIGLQNGWIRPSAPTGVPLKFDFLSERLKSLGYSTHAVGKWHLGFCSWKYTPLERGFDSFLGFYTGSEDYNSHIAGPGFDFRNNTDVLRSLNGTYSAEIFAKASVNVISKADPKTPLFLYLPFQSVHSPVEVPKRYEMLYPHVKNRMRRKYCGMVSALDEAVGKVVNALKQYGFYEDTLIIFTADNGGQLLAGGNNWPLRGNKANLFEGGNRGAAFVHGKMLKNPGTVNDGLIYAADWFPTILRAAGDPNIPRGIDGIDHWSVFTKGTPSRRNEMVYNILFSKDETHIKQAAIRIGRFKLVTGNPGQYPYWYPEPKERRNRHYSRKDISNMTAVYDLINDPTERINLKDKLPNILQLLQKRLQELSRTRVRPLPEKNIPAGNPNKFGGVYTPGWCKPIESPKIADIISFVKISKK